MKRELASENICQRKSCVFPIEHAAKKKNPRAYGNTISDEHIDRMYAYTQVDFGNARVWISVRTIKSTGKTFYSEGIVLD